VRGFRQRVSRLVRRDRPQDTPPPAARRRAHLPVSREPRPVPQTTRLSQHGRVPLPPPQQTFQSHRPAGDGGPQRPLREAALPRVFGVRGRKVRLVGDVSSDGQWDVATSV